MSAVTILKLCKRKKEKKKKGKTFMRLQNLSLFPRERGSVFEAIAYCVSLSPANSKAALFSFHQTLPLYFCSASVDREPRFWPHLSFRSLPHPPRSLLAFQQPLLCLQGVAHPSSYPLPCRTPGSSQEADWLGVGRALTTVPPAPALSADPG